MAENYPRQPLGSENREQHELEQQPQNHSMNGAGEMHDTQRVYQPVQHSKLDQEFPLKRSSRDARTDAEIAEDHLYWTGGKDLAPWKVNVIIATCCLFAFGNGE
jgi:hypothetical protein